MTKKARSTPPKTARSTLLKKASLQELEIELMRRSRPALAMYFEEPSTLWTSVALTGSPLPSSPRAQVASVEARLRALAKDQWLADALCIEAVDVVTADVMHKSAKIAWGALSSKRTGTSIVVKLGATPRALQTKRTKLVAPSSSLQDIQLEMLRRTSAGSLDGATIAKTLVAKKVKPLWSAALLVKDTLWLLTPNDTAAQQIEALATSQWASDVTLHAGQKAARPAGGERVVECRWAA